MRALLSGGVGRAVTVLVGVSVAVITGGTAIAQNGTSGVIHACVQRSSHEVRIMGPNQACKAHETAVQWNITGPAGAVGPQGPAGPAGPAGAPGASGGMTLVDSQGKTVGTLLDCCDVVINTSAGPVMLSFEDASGFESAGEFYFEEKVTANCTGKKLVRPLGVFSHTVVDSTTGTVYFATTFQQHTVLSQTFQQRGCYATQLSGLFGPAVTADLSGFTPPFSAR